MALLKLQTLNKMDSLKNKLEKNIEIFNTQVSYFHLKKVETIKTNGFYERLINWVTGEFDLYLKNESEILKVYFPNGWFSIRNFKDEKNQNLIEIKIEGKSRIACQKMMIQLEHVYNHVLSFTEIKANQYA
jgi:DNA mismatch repair ATPase MutS